MHSNSRACTNISFSLLQCYQLEARLGCVTLQYIRWAVTDTLPQTQALLKSAGKNQRGAERQGCSLVHILRWNSAVSLAGTHTVDTHSNTQDCSWHRLCFIWFGCNLASTTQQYSRGQIYSSGAAGLTKWTAEIRLFCVMPCEKSCPVWRGIVLLLLRHVQYYVIYIPSHINW